jgi:glycosyltransferase involved in cell wall biosynthesis
MPLRIAIDAHSVGTGLAGNETYATNLIESLAQIDGFNLYTLYVTKKEAVERFKNRWPNFTVRSTLPHSPLIRIPLTLSAELRRNRVDVLHVQFTAPPMAPCPVVVSIHDLSFEHLPQTFKRRSRIQLRMTVRRSARLASQVITLSNHARADIINTYNINPNKVTAIPLAAPAHFTRITDDNELQRVKQTYGINGPYILCVGSVQPRKNIARLLQAYSLLRRDGPAAKLPKLVIAGKLAWLFEETLRIIDQLSLKDSVVVTGYVRDADLPAMYSGARCFVYPSYFEGFGLPPLEAMKCGTAVIVGNQTSMPEVVGDAAQLVDPFDVDNIAAGIRKVITDDVWRSTLEARGLERAKSFDWHETARKTLEVYKKAAHSQSG